MESEIVNDRIFRSFSYLSSNLMYSSEDSNHKVSHIMKQEIEQYRQVRQFTIKLLEKAGATCLDRKHQNRWQISTQHNCDCILIIPHVPLFIGYFGLYGKFVEGCRKRAIYYFGVKPNGKFRIQIHMDDSPKGAVLHQLLNLLPEELLKISDNIMKMM